MKPVLEYLPKNSGESFVTKFFDYHYYPTPWHFHPEYELVLVTESTGTRFIGDHISDFQPGNLALLGPDLPHLYRNHAAYYQPESTLRAKSIVVHFKEDSFGDNFFDLPESQHLRGLFNRSIKGLEITGETNRIISEKLFELIALNGLPRWLKLLEILNILAESQDLNFITSNIITGNNNLESSRMNKVLDFVYKNFQNEITIDEVADIASMANNSFSRYFSQRTRQSFTSFVNEVRLGHATKLLIETHQSITLVSLECGFSNLSNFNRQFKNLYHQSPHNFRKHYRNV
ncbi:MAG TPA: AraC family transcriptional regulator [Mucilaginibacter sp.]